MNKREEEKLKRQQEKLKKELERTEAMSVYEKEHSDCQYICGIDEVGRGPFAGPVVAGAVNFQRKKERHCTMRLWNVLLQRESVL